MKAISLGRGKNQASVDRQKFLTTVKNGTGYKVMGIELTVRYKILEKKHLLYEYTVDRVLNLQGKKV